MNEVDILNEFIPTRFGYFLPSENGIKPKAVSYSSEKMTQETYKKKYEEQNILYQRGRCPLFVSPISIDNTTVSFFNGDIDAHAGKSRRPQTEVDNALQVALNYLRDLPVGIEKGPNGGYHFWLFFDRLAPLEPLEKFGNFLRVKLAMVDAEIRPSTTNNNTGIRLPGIYKDYRRFTIDGRTGKEIRTITDIRGYIKRHTIDPQMLLDHIDKNIDLNTFEQERQEQIRVRKSLQNKVVDPSTIKEGSILDKLDILDDYIPTGLDSFFEIVYTFIAKSEFPGVGEMAKCPFHEDNTPSFKTRYGHLPGEENKIFGSCFSENCTAYDKQRMMLDTLGMLHQHLFGHRNYSRKSISTCSDYVHEQILPRLLKKWTLPGGAYRNNVNLIELGEDVIRILQDEESKNGIGIDENHIIYLYDHKTRTWQTQADAKRADAVVEQETNKILEDLITPWGISYLGPTKLDKVVKRVTNGLKRPENMFFTGDDHKLLIPLKNGLLDLEKFALGQPNPLRPITKKDYVTATLNVVFDPKARNQAWMDAMKLYQPKIEIRNLVYSYIVACMIPAIEIQKSLACEGTGGNGKGTFANTMRNMFTHRLCANVGLDSFTKEFALFRLYGKLLNIDTDATLAHLSQNLISIFKKLTGGDPISFNMKYGPSFSDYYRGGFIILCNKFPALSADAAIARRVVPIKWEANVPKNDMGGFWQKIVESGYSGIFNEIVTPERVREFLDKRQLPIVDSVEDNKNRIFESDPIYQYVVSLFEEDWHDSTEHSFSDPNKRRLTEDELICERGVSASKLFSDYVLFCEQARLLKGSDIKSYSANNFYNQLKNQLNDGIFGKYGKYIRREKRRVVTYWVDVRQYKVDEGCDDIQTSEESKQLEDI